MPAPMASSAQVGTFRTTLTDAATSIFTVDLAADESTGGFFLFRIHAGNGTDLQSDAVFASFSAVNKAGTTTGTATYVSANEAKAVSAGTLTLTFTMTDTTNQATFKITPTGSLTETTYYVDWAVIMLDPDHFFMPA